jgi:hypothetical protein
MRSPFLDVTSTAIHARLRAIASDAAGGPCDVRVGPDAFGYRNVGVDLPRARRSADEHLLLRRRVWAALERAGVTMAPSQMAPQVAGDLRGTVCVRRFPPAAVNAAYARV